MDFPSFLNSLTPGFTPVLSKHYQSSDFVSIDLSKSNTKLNKIDVTSAVGFQGYIKKYLNKNKAKIAYGGYLENRSLYRRSSYFADNFSAERNIHIGLDIWSPAGTEVIAPLDGRVHSFENNINFGDYGPTIVLEHQEEDWLFYSLYGHLDKTSIEDLLPGYFFKKGARLGALGASEVNGDYAPHLHFQIIQDLEGKVGDYPGVIAKEDLAHYQLNCPDPNLLLKIN